MSLFIEKYTLTLNKLQSFFIQKNIRKEKSILICHTMLKRIIFFYLFCEILNIDTNFRETQIEFIISNNESDIILNSKYGLFNMNSFLKEFLPIDSKEIKLLTRKERKEITIIIHNFVYLFLWHPSENTNIILKENHITPIIFEEIFKLESNNKLGIVYTPQIVARWIVDITLSNYFSKRLGLPFFTKKSLNMTIIDIKNLLREILLNLRALDITVGCGSFCLALTEYLISIYKILNINPILVLKNIYGVEKNLEALQICRIRLFFLLLNEIPSIPIVEIFDKLKKLNLRKGDSILGFVENIKYRTYLTNQNKISNFQKKEIVIKNANKNNEFFNWNEEFPEVFNKNNLGFDIVVGNPPYIGYRHIPKEYKQILRSIYPEIYTGLNDYHYFFIWRGKQLLNCYGIMSLITSRYFLEAHFATQLRLKLFNETMINFIIDFREYRIFQDVRINNALISLTNCIQASSSRRSTMIILKKYDVPLNLLLEKITHYLTLNIYDQNEYFSLFIFNQKDLVNFNYKIISKESYNIISKIEKQSTALKNLCYIGTGFHTGNDRIFSKSIFKENENYCAITSDNGKKTYFPIESDLVKEIYKSSDILPFIAKWSNKFVLLIQKGINIEKYPLTKDFLTFFKDSLESRYEVKRKISKWYEISQIRNRKLFESKIKIFCPYRSIIPRFGIDYEQRYSSIDCSVIVPKHPSSINIYFLIGLLNSELVEFFLLNSSKKLDAKKLELYPRTISKIPIRIPVNQTEELLIEKIAKLVKIIIKDMIKADFSIEHKKLLTNKKISDLSNTDSIFSKFIEKFNKINILIYRLYGLEGFISEIKKEISILKS